MYDLNAFDLQRPNFIISSLLMFWAAANDAAPILKECDL
jgi:hypothetical protein